MVAEFADIGTVVSGPPSTLHPGGEDAGDSYRVTSLIREKTRSTKTDVRVFDAEPVSQGLDQGGVIVKIFTTPFRRTTSRSATNEANALKLLTKSECHHAPRLLHTYAHVLGSATTNPSSEHFIIMSKVPGTTLHEAHDRLSPKERVVARNSLEEAIGAIWDCDVDNRSHHLRNVIWDADEEKCYIVDYERAQFGDFSEREVDITEWGLSYDD